MNADNNDITLTEEKSLTYFSFLILVFYFIFDQIKTVSKANKTANERKLEPNPMEAKFSVTVTTSRQRKTAQDPNKPLSHVMIIPLH